MAGWSPRQEPRRLGDDGAGDRFCAALDSDDAPIIRWSWIGNDIESTFETMAQFLREWVGVEAWPVE